MGGIQLQATVRTAMGRQVHQLRRSGGLPAVVYGRAVPARSLEVAHVDFVRAYRAVGESTLLDLVLSGEAPFKVLIQDVARDPVSGAPIHVDFRAVSMTEKITTHIPLRFTGVAPALLAGGVLVKHLDRLEVEALPNDLVYEITVDLTPLAVVGAAIHLRDVKLPMGITARHASDAVVISVAAQAVEEAPVAERAVEDVAVEAKGKTEEAAADGKDAKPAKDTKKEGKKEAK